MTRLRTEANRMTWAQIIQLVSVLTGFVAAGTLFYGAIGIKPQDETWDGVAPHELARERRNKVLVSIGIPATAIAFVCQIALIFWPTN